MPAVYLDTNLVIAALTAEPMTVVAQRYLEASVPASAAISDWSVTEVSSALSIKIRAGGLPVGERDEALAEFRYMLRESIECWSVTRDDFHRAAALAEEVRSGLRAGDALHLAVAERAGLVVHTLDRGMARAAKLLHLQCVLAGAR